VSKAAVALFVVGLLLLTNAYFAGESTMVFVLDLAGGVALAVGGFWLAYGVGGAIRQAHPVGRYDPAATAPGP
jgi:hypothetical protein